MKPSQTPPRLEAVQVLRGIAALLVVVVHAINTNDFYTDMPRSWLGRGWFNDFGASGVDMFFVVSGFVMAHAMLAPSADSAGKFIANRFLRVVPYYWLASLVFLGAMTLTGRTFEPGELWNGLTIFPLYDYMVFDVPVLFVGWTLAFELGFYAVVAAAIAVAPSRERRLSIVFQAVMLVGLLGYLLAPAADLVSILLNPIWFEFGLGIAVYAIWKRRGTPMSPLASLGLIAFGMAALASTVAYGWPYTTEHWGVINDGAGLDRTFYWGTPSALVLLGLLSLTQGEWGERIADNRLWRGLVAMGDASYSLYLLHPCVIFLYEDILLSSSHNPDFVVVALAAVCLGLSLAAYRWIELPLVTLLRRRLLVRRSGNRGIAIA